LPVCSGISRVVAKEICLLPQDKPAWRLILRAGHNESLNL